jgi:5-methylcytosine-specific restriction endonuclease McrA
MKPAASPGLPRLDACPALVLNADYQPLSYFPLSLWGWQDAVKAMFLDRVAVVSYYDREIRSPSFRLRLPSVVALKEYVQQSHYPPFTRFNLFLRDRFACQYCGVRSRAEDLTFDHVKPRSRGGQTSWDNIVTACTRCNLHKANKLPSECGMPPRTPPRRPTTYELQRAGRAFPPNYLHESWRDFLYWDTELEP